MENCRLQLSKRVSHDNGCISLESMPSYPLAFPSVTENSRLVLRMPAAVPWSRSLGHSNSSSLASMRVLSFELASTPGDKPGNEQIEILRAEEGQYVKGAWQTSRIWNGDQTDRGLNFHSGNSIVVRIHLHTLPLYDESVRSPTQ